MKSFHKELVSAIICLSIFRNICYNNAQVVSYAAEDKGKRLQAVGLFGIGSLPGGLIAKDMIICAERDRITRLIELPPLL